jgi:putative flippase GtrA
MRALHRRELVRFVTFIAVGGLNTFVGYTLFAGLTLLGFGRTAAVIGATILGLLFNFQSIGRIVFASKDVRLLPRFIAVYVVQTCVNLGLLRLAIGVGLSSLLAEALILPVLAVLTYVLIRRFVFTLVAPQPETKSR